MSRESNDPYKSRVARLAVVGVLTVGVLGIIFAVNAMLAGDEIGSGVLLTASALAFGPLAYSTVRR